MSAVYCVFLGPRGEQKLQIYAVCDWVRAQTQGTDVEHGERGEDGLEFQSTERELVFDRCETLGDKWPEGAAGLAQLPQVLTLLCAMEVDIIITL